MKWGIGLYTGQVPADGQVSVSEEYQSIIEQAQLAEQLGIDSIWLSEHHGAEDGYLPSLLPLAAAILQATERLVVGTAVLLAPFHHPIRLAEDVAVLDQLSGGRFILGMGTGWRDRESRSFGLDPRRRGVTLDETVAFLRRAWTGERFDFHGRVHQFDDVLVRPRPFTPGGPPIWLGGTGPRALERAGRLAAGHFGVGMGFDQALVNWKRAVAAREPDAATPFAFGQLRSGFIAGDPDEAFALASAGMRYTLGVHAGWAAEMAGGSPDDAPPVTDEQLRDYNLFGGPTEVIEGLAPYSDEFAGRDDCHLSFKLHHPYVPRDAVLAAIDVYGKQVVPQLRALERTDLATRPR